MWRIYRAAGRPVPSFSEDAVIDYMVLEAVAVKVQAEDAKAEKEARKKEWRKDRDHLKQFQ